MMSYANPSSPEDRRVDQESGLGLDAQPSESAAAAGNAAAAGGDQTRPAPAAETPDDLAEELRVCHDRLLRTLAELENYRKRVRREMDEQRRYAALPLIRDMLGVVDHLRLAIEAAEQNDHADGLLEGVKMVASQLQSVLQQHHCQSIDAAGRPFDPNCHEAIAYEPSEEHSAGQITRVVRAGYQLHDRVIRPSQVFVSSGAPAPNQQTAQE